MSGFGRDEPTKVTYARQTPDAGGLTTNARYAAPERHLSVSRRMGLKQLFDEKYFWIKKSFLTTPDVTKAPPTGRHAHTVSRVRTVRTHRFAARFRSNALSRCRSRCRRVRPAPASPKRPRFSRLEAESDRRCAESDACLA